MCRLFERTYPCLCWTFRVRFPHQFVSFVAVLFQEYYVSFWMATPTNPHKEDVIIPNYKSPSNYDSHKHATDPPTPDHDREATEASQPSPSEVSRVLTSMVDVVASDYDQPKQVTPSSSVYFAEAGGTGLDASLDSDIGFQKGSSTVISGEALAVTDGNSKVRRSD